MAQRAIKQPAACGRGAGCCSEPRTRLVINRYSCLSILLVSLFAAGVALVEAKHLWQQQQQPPVWRNYQQQAHRQQQQHQQPSELRPTVYEAPPAASALAQQQEQQQQQREYDSDDEQFLRQLKLAAGYLNDNLAQRQRQRSLNERRLELGASLAGDSGQAADADTSKLLRRLGSYALETSNPRNSLLGDEAADADDGAPEQMEGTFGAAGDAVAPQASTFSSYNNINGNGGLMLQLQPEYRVQLDTDEPSELPEHHFTYDNYKLQLLKSLLLDKDAQQQQQLELPATDKRQVSTSSDLGDDNRVTTTRAKLTTLLEDEYGSETKKKDASGGEKNGTSSEKEAASFGKLIYEKQGEDKSDKSSSSGGGGVFSRMYAHLSQYLPFMHQIATLRNNTGARADGQESSAAGGRDDGQHHRGQRTSDKPDSEPQVKSKHVEKQQQPGNATDNELHAKQSVSAKSMSHGKKELKGDGEEQRQQAAADDQIGEFDDAAAAGDDDKSPRENNIKVSVVRSDADKDKKANVNGVTLGATKSGNSKRLSVGASLAGDPTGAGNNDDELEMDMSQMMPVVVSGAGDPRDSSDVFEGQLLREGASEPRHKYNLLRQSSLFVPQHESTEADGAGSKYIYAPTHHYYLSSVLPSTHGSSGHPSLSPAQHHAHLLGVQGSGGIGNSKARQLIGSPDGELYGSPGAGGAPPLKAYAYQKDPTLIVSSAADKTNDLYFLVMVGAFCVMAMAVVLAAGMFAYRVQQSRKMSQEQDYPTYGVVGPNNMSGGGGGAGGKCGSASFGTMGNYFVGGTGGALHGSSKSGSVKHLADLYGAAAVANNNNNNNSHHQHPHVLGGGGGGSDSGINSLGGRPSSRSNKKNSSSASSLNNDATSGGGAPADNSASGRTAPAPSYMAAVSQDAARMYHYQHQKQQMIISDRNHSNAAGRHASASDLDSDDENDDGSYTVYECPGLASAHEMEIKNPLFNDDQTP